MAKITVANNESRVLFAENFPPIQKFEFLNDI